MVIDLQNLQGEIKVSEEKIKKCAEQALEALGEGKSELSLLLVNDAYIRRLNHKYRNVDSRTDVLAFSMREGEGLSKKSPILGDVVISVETAKREAEKRNKKLHEEICLYLIHGVLHLLGYDDSVTHERKKMEAKQKELLRLM